MCIYKSRSNSLAALDVWYRDKHDSAVCAKAGVGFTRCWLRVVEIRLMTLCVEMKIRLILFRYLFHCHYIFRTIHSTCTVLQAMFMYFANFGGDFNSNLMILLVGCFWSLINKDLLHAFIVFWVFCKERGEAICYNAVYEV